MVLGHLQQQAVTNFYFMVSLSFFFFYSLLFPNGPTRHPPFVLGSRVDAVTSASNRYYSFLPISPPHRTSTCLVSTIGDALKLFIVITWF